jgi:hypothetical protein
VGLNLRQFDVRASCQCKRSHFLGAGRDRWRVCAQPTPTQSDTTVPVKPSRPHSSRVLMEGVDRYGVVLGIGRHHRGESGEPDRRLERTGVHIMEVARNDRGRRHLLTALSHRIAEEVLGGGPAHPRPE